MRCHQISEAVLLWRYNQGTFGETENEIKYATLLRLTDILFYNFNFILNSVFNFSLQHLFNLLCITQSRVYNEFMMSADGWLPNKYGTSIITTYWTTIFLNIYLCVARVSVRAPCTNFGKTKSLTKQATDTVLWQFWNRKTECLSVGVFKSRDFIDETFVIFYFLLCKSPKLFVFIGYASTSQGPFDI